MSPRKKSYLTVTDQFCGAGGSSIGAAAAGMEIRMAMNHWALAVETHNTNFPETDHDCADISASDPRRYPSTDILITSPECTTHSPAGGNRHKRSSSQSDLFMPLVADAATERSRATMWDVVRFTEYHHYLAVIVENVVEVRRWPLFSVWWQAMEALDYVGKIVSANSMFVHPTPQSRDRVYIVWTKKKNHRPDLAISPLAPCLHCGDVEAQQSWKNGRTVGKYGARNQYVYTCPKCRATVLPYYFCALNALDFSIPAKRIGDRDYPLKPKTLARVQYGLDTYGSRPLQVTVNNVSGLECRVRGVDRELFGQTTSNTTALVAPFLLGLSQSSAKASSRVRSTLDAAPAQTTCDDVAIAGAPWMVNAGSNGFRTRSTAYDVVPTLTGSERAGIAGFNPFMVTLRTNENGKPLDAPLPAVACSPGHHALIQPAALVRLMGDRAVSSLDQVVPTQSTGQSQNMLVSPSPFLVQYYGTGKASPTDDALDAVSTKDRHALVEPRSLDILDCFFRMLAAREIGLAMAFPGTYTVLGTSGEQIRQYGNAVTPPVMALLIKRVQQSITGERAA